MEEAGKIKIVRGLSSIEIFERLVFFGLVLFILSVSAVCMINAMRLVNKPFAGFLVNQRMVLTNVGQFHWTGTKAGLVFPDKILKANKRPLSSIDDLDNLVSQTPVGKPISYSVEREGKIITVDIPTMFFTSNDLFVTFGIFFFSGIVYLILGVIVFLLKPHNKVSWAFLITCLTLSAFTTTAFDNTNLAIVRINLFVLTFFPAGLIHLALLFPERKKLTEKHQILQFIPYMIAAVIAVPLVISYPGPLFQFIYQFVFVYILIGTLALTVSTLHAFIKRTSALARERSKIVLLGAAVAFPIPALILLIDTFGIDWAGVPMQENFLAIPILVFPASIAYAIAKHNLFDVDVYIKRAVGYGFMTAIVGLIYFSLQTVIRTVILGPLVGDYAEKVYPILFAILVVFLFNPINRRVQGAVDKLFYRKKFDYKETVISVSHALTSVLNLSEVIKRIINTVRKEMFIDTAGIILLEPQKKECQTLFVGDESAGAKEQIKNMCIPSDDPLLSVISQERKLITKYDVEEDPRYANLRESCGQRFSEMGASILTPFIYQGQVTGALALGYKKSGHFYTREDIDLLETLTNHGAVAIENARLAEQMKKEETVRTNLARYLSPQIVDQIITKDVQVNLGGDRKVVTVLFSDIRNFTTITETRPPDQLVQILNEYFTEMAKIIFENQGSLDKYIGDAIVAVFGSLIPLDNSAKNAVNAAIQMMKQLPVLNEKWLKEYGFSMQIGIGINTGEVFLGNIGSPERMEFTVIGDTVNVASRFSGLAQPAQILMTQETLNFLGNDVPHKELPASMVKGKAEKLKVFEILYS